MNNDKTIRFPSLDGVSRSSSPRFLDIDDPDNEEVRGFNFLLVMYYLSER